MGLKVHEAFTMDVEEQYMELPEEIRKQVDNKEDIFQLALDNPVVADYLMVSHPGYIDSTEYIMEVAKTGDRDRMSVVLDNYACANVHYMAGKQ